MASNSFGIIFRMTTWGESHGRAIGVVIDGCPSGICITEEDINQELALRAPGRNPFTSPRQEKDLALIYSGIYEGKTTGCPISILIGNHDIDSSKYHPVKDILRPGHAQFAYLQKYGIFDPIGGGRSSARETVARVAAGAVAKKFLVMQGIKLCSFLKAAAGHAVSFPVEDFDALKKRTSESAIFCPDPHCEKKIGEAIASLKEQGDSTGGIVETHIINVPAGLGDPVYEKMEARLAYAMMGLPASKGFEIGEGFAASSMHGSQHNDVFIKDDDKIITKTNHAGGILGGITNGMPLFFRVAFKPTSSIKDLQESVTTLGEKAAFQLPEGSRHDPCVAIRAVPVVESMAALVLADAILMNRLSKESL